MLDHFTQFIQLIKSPQAKFGVATSGGIDSVVLCELCAQAHLPFFIVHCNFGLRGEESNRDEHFVRSLGGKYGVDVLVKHFDTTQFALAEKQSIQEAARSLRYQWFKELHDEGLCAFILLAHHANDNIETLLMNFFRGTGLEGLTGIPQLVEYAHCLRPLLRFSRKEIEAFARENELEWVEDSSNDSNKYTRNFFRNELIPSIKKVYPQVEETLLKNISRFNQINRLYTIGVERMKKELIEHKPPEVHILIQKLLKYRDTAIVYELIKDYSFGEKQVEEVLKLTDSESGKFIENGQFQIIKHRSRLIITPKIEASSTIAVESGKEEVLLHDRIVRIKIVDCKNVLIDKSPAIAQLDADKIEFPLLFRKWKQGDYFYPLGMPKKKKLARFFIDQKLSKSDKEKVWIVESNKKIIWVVGMRIDDRLKVNPSTKKILQLSVTNL